MFINVGVTSKTYLVQFVFVGRWNSDQVVFLVLLLETKWPSSKPN